MFMLTWARLCMNGVDVCAYVYFGRTCVHIILDIFVLFRTVSESGSVWFGSVVRSRRMGRSRAIIDWWKPCNESKVHATKVNFMHEVHATKVNFMHEVHATKRWN